MKKSETAIGQNGSVSSQETARNNVLTRCMQSLNKRAKHLGLPPYIGVNDTDVVVNASMEYECHVEEGVSNVQFGIEDQIMHAKHMARAGYYGVCECCNTEIPVERMEALPYATSCTGCAAKNEAENGVNYAKRGREHEAGWSNYPDSGDEPSGCLDKVKKERR